MICPYCGNDNPPEASICGFCGGPLAVVEEQPASDANPLEPDFTIIESPSPQPETPPVSTSPPSLQPPRGIYGNRIWLVVGCVVIFLLFLCCVIATISLYRAFNGIRLFNSPAAISQATLPAIITVSVEALQDTPSPVDISPSVLTPKVIYADDFSDPNSGWDRADEADYFTDYYSGAYRIIVNTDMSDSWANPDDNLFNDTITEVDTVKNGGPDMNDFGLICRYQGVDQFYYAIITSDGYYGISKVTSDSSEILGTGELSSSKLINRGDATNHIRFDCVGDMLTLYVNGRQIDQQTDSTYTSGNVGLIAGTYDTAGTDILFDNFYVLQP